MSILRVKLINLKPGMQVADDVYNQDAQLIVPKGVCLTSRILDRLTYYSIESVLIFPPDEPVEGIVEGEEEAQEAEEPKTHSQKLRESEEFLRYSEAFYEAKESFKYELNDIADRNAKVDVDKMFSTTSDILKTADSSYQVFDMLHNMRHFDDSTFAHSLNASIICNIMGKWLHMSEDDIKILTVAGLMHDIGKLLIPNEIITKPGKLTDEEYKIIQKHPKLGYDLLVNQDLDPRIAQTALCHHEKCDGSGYPMKLTAERIPPFAKIVCIVDIYEAMTADRVYRKGLCPFEVIRMFESEGFQKYDTEYILTFLKGIVQTYMNETVLLSNGEQGAIIMINDSALSRPVIFTKDRFIDLTKERDLSIVQIL